MEYEISVQNFQELREDQSVPLGNACLLEVRQPWETEVATIPDSYLIPMNQVPLRAPADLNPNAHIVVY